MAPYPREECPDCGAMICTRQMARHRTAHSDPMALVHPTPEQVTEMVRLYQHHSMLEVARMTHWSLSCVQRVLALSGTERRRKHITMHPKRLDNETLLKTAELYGRGLTMTQVAELMDCSLSTVSRRLRTAGTKTRPRSWRPHRDLPARSLL